MQCKLCISSCPSPSTLARTSYLYRDLGDHKTSQQIYGMDISFGLNANPNNKFLYYTYDNAGNIASESENGVQKKSYEYDEIGQLIRVNDVELDRTFVYIYNASGNMTQKREYTYRTGAITAQTPTLHITDYEYSGAGLTDKLVNVKIDGVSKPISYDNSYNMTGYNGISYTWQGGRQLASATKNGVTSTYKYNDAGIRTQKTVDGKIYEYILINDKVTAEKTPNMGWIYYRYGGNGELLPMWYNGDEYFFIRNLQGDIIAIVEESGYLVAKYSYDAWGNPISITDGNDNDVSNDPYHIANINPYRYRGYRYDSETGLYYLQSRYYNPELGRFISMDDTKILMLTQSKLLSANLFAYCYNNPVMYSDPSGYYPTPEEMQLMCLQILPNPYGYNAIDVLILRRLQINSPTGYKNYTTFQDLHKKYTGKYFILPFQGDITCTVTSDKITWLNRALTYGAQAGFTALVSIGSAGVGSFIGGTFVVGGWITDDMPLGSYTVYKVTVKKDITTTHREDEPSCLGSCYRMVTRKYPREYTYTFYYGPIDNSYGKTLYPPILSMKDYTLARSKGVLVSKGPIVKCFIHGGF